MPRDTIVLLDDIISSIDEIYFFLEDVQIHLKPFKAKNSVLKYLLKKGKVGLYFYSFLTLTSLIYSPFLIFQIV